MARHPNIADRLRSHGLDVVEHTGWKTRGSTLFFPRGVVGHHTASRAGSDVPSLRICINGRTDLAGPLCHVLISRSAQCHMIAAGRANHAGTGGWKGLTGNRSVFGIEVENNGVGEPWKPAVVRAFDLAAAALLEEINAPADYYCGHKEWTRRKIDPFGLDMNEQRARIRAILTGAIVPDPTSKHWEALQRALAGLGIDPGPIDGIPGPKTRAAIVNALKLAGGEEVSTELAAARATITKQTQTITKQSEFIRQLSDGVRQLATSAAKLADRTLS